MLPGNDDNDLERSLSEEPVEADEETAPAEERWFLKAAVVEWYCWPPWRSSAGSVRYRTVCATMS